MQGTVTKRDHPDHSWPEGCLHRPPHSLPSCCSLAPSCWAFLHHLHQRHPKSFCPGETAEIPHLDLDIAVRLVPDELLGSLLDDLGLHERPEGRHGGCGTEWGERGAYPRCGAAPRATRVADCLPPGATAGPVREWVFICWGSSSRLRSWQSTGSSPDAILGGAAVSSPRPCDAPARGPAPHAVETNSDRDPPGSARPRSRGPGPAGDRARARRPRRPGRGTGEAPIAAHPPQAEDQCRPAGAAFRAPGKRFGGGEGKGRKPVRARSAGARMAPDGAAGTHRCQWRVHRGPGERGRGPAQALMGHAGGPGRGVWRCGRAHGAPGTGGAARRPARRRGEVAPGREVQSDGGAQIGASRPPPRTARLLRGCQDLCASQRRLCPPAASASAGGRASATRRRGGAGARAPQARNGGHGPRDRERPQLRRPEPASGPLLPERHGARPWMRLGRRQ